MSRQCMTALRPSTPQVRTDSLRSFSVASRKGSLSFGSRLSPIPYFQWRVGHDRILSRLLTSLLDDAIRQGSLDSFSRFPLQYRARTRLQELLDPGLGLVRPRVESVGVIVDTPLGESRTFDVVLSFKAECHSPRGTTFLLDRMSVKL